MPTTEEEILVVPESELGEAVEETVSDEIVASLATLSRLLSSRGLRRKAHELLGLTCAAVEGFPEVQIVAPGKALTPSEIAVLQRGGFRGNPDLVEDGSPLFRSAASYGAILVSSLNVAEAAMLLGVASSRIRQRLTRERTLYGIKQGRAWKLPSFQFCGNGLVPGIDEVFKHLASDLHPVEVVSWFTLPHPDLFLDGHVEDLSPLKWLEMGQDSSIVADLAAHL